MEEKRLYHIVKTELGYVCSWNNHNEVEFSPLRSSAVMFPLNITKDEFVKINSVLYNGYECSDCEWIIEMK